MSEKSMTITVSLYMSTLQKINDFRDFKQFMNFSQAVRNLINLGYAKHKEMTFDEEISESEKK